MAMMTRILLLAVMACISTVVHSQTLWSRQGVTPVVYFASPQAVCDAYAAESGPDWSCEYVQLITVDNYKIKISNTSNYSISYATSIESNCPSAYVYDFTQQSCVPEDLCSDKAGQPSSDYGHVPLSEFTPLGCKDGCTTAFQGIGPSWFIENGKLTGYMEGEYTYFGDTCTVGTQPSTGPAPVESCGPDQTGGTINGNFVCLDQNGPTEPDPPTQEEQDKEDEILQQQEPPRITQTDRSENTVDNGDGTTTTTETITETFSDGSTRTTTNTTTTNADGSTTTTSGTSTTGGDAERQEQKEEEEENGNFTDSGCQVAPRCTGDALQCAIARQAWETKCNLVSDTDEVTEADVMAQTGQTQTVEDYFDHANPDNVIDTEQLYNPPTASTASCPADISVTTRFGNFNFSYQPLCDLGALVRPLILALSVLIVAFMFYYALLRTF